VVSQTKHSLTPFERVGFKKLANYLGWQGVAQWSYKSIVTLFIVAKNSFVLCTGVTGLDEIELLAPRWAG
jgi:hypothetical protein